MASSLQQYRDGHAALIKWIEETTERQENAQPGQTDSRALAEQLAQQTVSVTDARVIFRFPNLLVTLKVKNATLRICVMNETLSAGFYVLAFAFFQALVAEIEQNQVKLDECQTHSKQYCTSVKVNVHLILTEMPCLLFQVTVPLSSHFACIVQDYELQLMTYRAFVESTHKSPGKRRRMHSSSDAITQEVRPPAAAVDV